MLLLPLEEDLPLLELLPLLDEELSLPEEDDTEPLSYVGLLDVLLFTVASLPLVVLPLDGRVLTLLPLPVEDETLFAGRVLPVVIVLLFLPTLPEVVLCPLPTEVLPVDTALLFRPTLPEELCLPDVVSRVTRPLLLELVYLPDEL